MIGGIQPLQVGIHRWSDLLSTCGVTKVGFYNPTLSGDGLVSRLITRCSTEKPPFRSCICTYTGFYTNPQGLIFRDMIKKAFHLEYFGSKSLLYYVAQDFEIHLDDFCYGQPIILVEGVLDVEATRYLLNYPYVMGYLTSSVSLNLAAFLSTITNRILIIPDNDAKQHTQTLLLKSISNFSKFKISPKVCTIQQKDMGDVLLNNDIRDIMVVKNELSSLIK